MNCRKDRQYNEKKKTTLFNERRQTSRVDYRNGQLLSNKSDGLLDMGGVMKKFSIAEVSTEVKRYFEVEAETEEEAKDLVLSGSVSHDDVEYLDTNVEIEEISDE